MVDISKEAVERLVHRMTDKEGFYFDGRRGEMSAATLRAQAARIAELELQVEREREENRWAYVNAALEDSTTQARNNALREAAEIVGRYDEESTCPSCCDVTAINEEVTALIEGATND